LHSSTGKTMWMGFGSEKNAKETETKSKPDAIY